MKKKTIFIFRTIYESFKTNRIQLLSATQTYYTLLAIVPIIALFISLGETFNISKLVEKVISHLFADQKDIASYLITFAQNTLQEAKKTSFKIFGIAILFWASIKMLVYIDVGVNQLWSNPQQPNFLKRKVRFIIVLLSVFFLFFIAGSWNFFLTFTLNFFLKQEALHTVAKWIVYASNLLPSFLLIMVLSFLYYFVPYEKIRISNALLAGVITAIGYEIFQVLYFAVQIFVSNYNKVYGTFAAFPLFLVWVHFSWVIFFVGAKLCFSLSKPIKN